MGLNQLIHFQVVIWDGCGGAWQAWKLIPVKVESTSTPLVASPPPRNLDSCSFPSYDGGITGQSTIRTQHVESKRDEFGTIVSEVTFVTTHKIYRVPDP